METSSGMFDNVNSSVDKAANYLDITSGLLEQIKQCNGIYRMSFPVLDDAEWLQHAKKIVDQNPNLYGDTETEV